EENTSKKMEDSQSEFTIELSQGTWKIYVDDVYTEMDINESTTTAELNYYTIEFEAEIKGNAADVSSLEAIYDGEAIESGRVVLGGKTLVLTATGKGSAEYEYTWSVENEDIYEIDEHILSFNNLSAKVDATCVINGVGKKQLAGTVVITIESPEGESRDDNIPRIGDTLIASLKDRNYEDDLIFVWISEEESIILFGNDKYIVKTDDFDKKIFLEISPEEDTDDIEGMLTAFTEPVAKKIPTESDFEYTISNRIYGDDKQGVSVEKINPSIGEIEIYYDDSTDEPDDAGEYEITVKILGNSTYEERWFELGAYIIEQADGIFKDTAISITYTPALKLSDLGLTENYEWDENVNLETLLYADDNQPFAAIYTESKNHTSASGNIIVNVAKANPEYTAPDDLHAVYGADLSSVDLPNGWSWEGEGTVGNAGTQTHKATFTPEDPDNYKIESGVDLKITVGRAAPERTIPSELHAVYGADLSSVILPDGWSWEGEGTVGDAGTQTHKATFTPEDPDNYNIESGVNVSISVSRIPLLVSANNVDISYGMSAPSYVANYSGFVLGEDASVLGGALAFICDYALGSNVGEYYIVPDGLTSDNYEIAFVSGLLTVSKAVPSVDWPSASHITYGQPLSASVLSGGSGDGEFAWADGSAIPLAGSDGYDATFTPTDLQNYVELTQTIYLEVKKSIGNFYSPARIIVPHTPDLTLGDIELPSGYALNLPPETPLPIGHHSFLATYADPSGNYLPAQGYIRITITDESGNVPILIHSLLPTPHSPIYYDLKGTSLGTQKPTSPGIYIEKIGTQTKRIMVK
ncbi:MAG: hypothetical protein FWH22_02835, partial [Fibromonadales bacterium]|nr:hypothetical protein [Fibromonadales bacterium]